MDTRVNYLLLTTALHAGQQKRGFAMAETGVLLDAFTRVYESLHRTVADLTQAELIQEPHPPIGWLAWRLSRVMDSNVSRLAGRE